MADGSAPDDVAPRLAEGVEVLGPCEGGAAEEARYLYRLADGEAVQVTRLMHLVASRLDGNGISEISRQVTDEVGRRLSPENVRFLIDEKLRPLGLVAGDDESVAPASLAPLLGLRFRAALVPAAVVRRATALLRPLFLPPVVITVLVAYLATVVWVFVGHGIGGGLRQVLHQSLLIPAVWLLIVLSGVFHELGHATACRYGGGRPGRIGFGLYLIWPVFYSDVTDSYRLGRRGRLRTDLGGLYFNVVFLLLSAAVYALTGSEFLLVVVAVQHLAMLQQLLPFVRLDGYYVVSDLVGVPDLFPYVKPIVTSSVRRRPPHPAVALLGRGARRVVTAWVVVTLAILAASIAVLAVHVPEWSATTWESVTVHARALAQAIEDGDVRSALGPFLNAAALLVPVVGVTLTLLLSVGRAARAVNRRIRRSRNGLDQPRKEARLVDEMTNRVPEADVGDRLDDARATIDQQADQLFTTLFRTVEAVRQELYAARTLRAKAEEEADAIRAAARRDAAALLARTRSGVQALFEELSRETLASAEAVPAPPPTTNGTRPPGSAGGPTETVPTTLEEPGHATA